MTLGQQIRKCEKYSGKPKGDIPWEVLRLFPNIDVSCTGVAFDIEGDYVSIPEAIVALKLLIEQLK